MALWMCHLCYFSKPPKNNVKIFLELLCPLVVSVYVSVSGFARVVENNKKSIKSAALWCPHEKTV